MKNKSTLVIIFLTIFIDLLGFGIFIPLLPSFSINELHISESMIGLTVGIYSLMQFLFSSVWGSLSDRYGRKPVLVMSLIGSFLAYILLALVFSGVILSALLLIISRAFAGIFAANLSAAQAVISDITAPEDRTKGIGLISAAFGLGFVFGPAIGGILSDKFGYGFPIYVSACLSLTATLLCIFVFRETLPVGIRMENRIKSKIRNPLDIKQISKVLKNENTGKFIIIFFVNVLAFSNIFGTLQMFAERKDVLNLSQAEIGYLFSFMGVVGAFVQLVLLRIVKARIGEDMTLILGCFLAFIGLAFMGFLSNIFFMLLFVFLLSAGNGMSSTVSISLLSQNTGPNEQGSILGINQSLGAFARFLGPTWGGFVYQYLGYRSPFITGGIFMLLITVYSYNVLKKQSAGISE